MTKEDLKKMGMDYIGTKLNPNLFFIPYVGEVNLFEPYKWEDIFQMVYHLGYENGKREGEKNKVLEIKRILDIDDI